MIMSEAFKLIFFVAGLLIPSVVTGQIAPAPGINEILDKAQLESKLYREKFKNLLATEIKNFETYDKKGDVKNRRQVTSTFVVYQLTKAADQIAEYRNVLAVDGKPLEKADLRAQDFFENIARAESSAQELSELRKESLRHDLDLLINGLTLYEGIAIEPNLRPVFEFSLDGKQIVDGAEVYAISYRQVRGTPDIAINSDAQRPVERVTLNFDVDVDAGGPLNERMRGKLLIDSATYRLWREEREITIQPAGVESPMVVIHENFDFQRSEFDLLVPKKITHIHYRAKVKDRAAIKETQVTFDYSKFTKPDVQVKSADVK